MEIIKKTIKGLEPYKADNLGNIYGLKGQKLKTWSRGKNRAYSCLDIKGKTYSVHRLVAFAFGLIDSLNFDGTMVDHINEVKDDNRLVNLQPISNSDNIRKSNGGDMSLPKGVSLIKSRGLYRYTEYPEGYPKGKIIKHSKDLNKLIEFISERNNEFKIKR